MKLTPPLLFAGPFVLMPAFEAKVQIAITPRPTTPGASATAGSPDPDAPRVIEGVDATIAALKKAMDQH